RVKDVLWLDVKALDVVEPPVRGFGYHRQAPRVAGVIRYATFNPPCDDRIARDTDAVSICKNDRSIEETAFLNPGCAGHFTVAIQAEEACVNGIVERIVAPRENSGHASAHRAFANLKFSIAANQRRIADSDARNIRDRGNLSRRAFKRNPEISSTNNYIINDGGGCQRILRYQRGRREHGCEDAQ